MNDFDSKLQSSEIEMFYLGSETCSACKVYSPLLKDFKDYYNFDYFYLNADDLRDNDLDYILDKLEISEFSTPYTVILKDGEVLDYQKGYMLEEELFGFLQENKIIGDEAKLPINYIDLDDYKQLLNSKNKEIIVYGQVGCGACESVRPIFYEIAKEENVKINYFNLSGLSNEEGEYVLSSLAFLKDNEWGTPLMLVVENNKTIDSVKGAANKEIYLDFLEKNGFIE
ncbi:MAG: thioredoxin family protein [Bacilli bacterium]|nr:thioredoxin family protein [Bacilli bacterium]